jgi:hypothetical protein
LFRRSNAMLSGAALAVAQGAPGQSLTASDSADPTQNDQGARHG